MPVFPSLVEMRKKRSRCFVTYNGWPPSPAELILQYLVQIAQVPISSSHFLAYLFFIYLHSILLWTKNDLGAAQKNVAQDHKNICRNFTKYLEEVRKKRGWEPPQSSIFGFATLPLCLSNLSFYNQSRPQNVRKLQFIMTWRPDPYTSASIF